MRYFKIVLACFGFIFAVVGITAGALFLAGKFEKEVIQPQDIAFEITEKLTEDDFEVVVNTTTENVTEKNVTLSLTNQTEIDGMISDGVVTVPKVVTLGTPFTVKVNKTHYAGMTEEWNVGGTSIIRAKSTNPLIQEASPLTVEVDVPVYSLGVELVTTTGAKIGTVSARDSKNYMKTLAEGDENKNVVELAVGSIVRLKPIFVPEKSQKTTKGEQRKVLFEIPNAWRGIDLDFVDGENDLIEILRQTTTQDIKINAYCFRTSADEYENKQLSDEDMMSKMSQTGVQGQSSQIFGTNQKITSFTSSNNDKNIDLSINVPTTLFANGEKDNAFNLGLGLASDAGVAKLEDKIAVIKLFAYWKNTSNEWVDAGDKLLIVGQTSSSKTNGVKAKINKNDSNLSSWNVIASEKGEYKIVARLSYEYYSSSSTTPTIIDFEIPFEHISVSEPISSDVAWKNTLPAIKTLVVLDGETAAEKYYPTLNLAEYVDIKNPNATYKVVRFFAYSTENVNLSNVIDCSLYAGNFAVPDSSKQYEVFEIQNGILTAKDVGTFRIFFATVVSDYKGNPKIQSGQYQFESFSNTNTINVVKSLKQLDASMTVNSHEGGKDYNKNTDESTRDHVFHVRQQDENVFTLSLFVSDVEIFERDYADGKISIDFLLAGQKSNILSLGDYEVDETAKRIDFQVSVNSLPSNDQPTLECKITYDIDHRLDKFVSNNNKKVQIKVLNGFAQEIAFDAVKNAVPKNSAANPIQIEIKFNAGSDNIATKVEHSITFNGQTLELNKLSNVTINDEALNKTYSLSSNKPSVIAVNDTLEGKKLSILGSTTDEDVVVTATAADGSGISTSMYFRVHASLQITLTPNESEITIDGYQGNQINFRSYFTAVATDGAGKEIKLNNLLYFDVPTNNTNKFVFENNDTLKIVSTLGRDASLQLYITSEFGFSKVVPIRIVSCVNVSSTYAFNDMGLDDEDFAARQEEPPTERGTRVYAENGREITFKLSLQKSSGTEDISVSTDDFELPSNGVQDISYVDGVLTICFDAVSQMTEKTITFKKNFSDEDEFAFVYTMKFLVFPNIKSSLVSSVGAEANPASFVSGETVIYDVRDNSNGLIKLERVLGDNTISENATLDAKIDGEWVPLTKSSGQFKLPESFRAPQGSFVDVRVTYDGYQLPSQRIFLNPNFEGLDLPETKVLYGGKLYIPFVAKGNNPIALSAVDGVTYRIQSGTSEQYLKINQNQIEKLDKIFTQIITSEKLYVQNKNGSIELPILILPIKYPFVVYDSIENAASEETYRSVDLQNVIESQAIYDILEAGEDEVIDLKSKILVDGLEDGRAIVSVQNGDGSVNNYVNFNSKDLTITANSVGKDQMIFVKVKCGAEFENAFEFVYRIKIAANQQIKVFYPYIEYNEEYDVSNKKEYLYFGSTNQISLDLMGEFDANLTPNKNLLDKLFESTSKSYARRFVVVREKDGKIIPTTYKDFNFEIASLVIGGSIIGKDDVWKYVTINQKTTTSGELQSANMIINRGDSIGDMEIRIRAYTLSGAEAYYNFKVINNPISYVTFYKNQEIETDDFSVASEGQSEINLNERVLVKTAQNPQQVVSPNAYKFYLIVNEKLGTDYSQFIELVGGLIKISTLVNDVETTVVLYNEYGEISRFNLILKCTIDHEIKSTTIGSTGEFDIGKNIDFFNTAESTNIYSMKELSTRLYVRNYLNGTDIGTTQANNLFVNVGGYSINDISKEYNQYVLLDNIKVYAENLFDTWEGKFYLGNDAKYNINQEGEKEYIYFNNNRIDVQTDAAGDKFVLIPLESSTGGQTVKYKITKTADGKYENYVIIPHLKFSSGNDTRDYALFDEVVYEGALGETKLEPYNTRLQTGEVASCTTYVYAYVNGFIRYKVNKIKNGDDTELKVSILRVSHNNNQYIANIDPDHNDDEYIVVGEKKHYFTRFYTIKYDGLAENYKDEEGKDVVNVPRVRYMLAKGADGNYESGIDLRKIIFYTQDGKSQNVLKLDDPESYVEGMFKFYQVKNGKETEVEGFDISISNFDPIDIVIKDTTGKYVVGRLTIVPTVETSTDSAENNQTIFINAGENDVVDYKMADDSISKEAYKAAMTKNGETTFTGDIKNDHIGWENYVYNVSSEKFSNLSIDKEEGTISGLSGLEPWGDVTVGAKLQYKNTDTSKTLTTSISFDEWKEKLFDGYAYLFPTYEDLTDLIGADFGTKYRFVVNSGKLNSETGEISDVAYGETVTISFQKKCDNCGKWATIGEDHKHWIEGPTDTITELKTSTGSDIFRDNDLNTLSDGVSRVEIFDTSTKYVYVLTKGSRLDYITGEKRWILTGSITKTTYNQETCTPQFTIESSSPKTYTSLDRLQRQFECLGYNDEKIEENYKSFSENRYWIRVYGKKDELSVWYDLTDGSTLAKNSETNKWTLNGSMTKKVNVSASDLEIKGLTKATSAKLNLSDETGYATLARALFDESATTILGYESWDTLLGDCDVEWSGYDADKKTFGGTKTINLTITTKNAKHTGTFYLVNQENDKSTLHGTGNLDKIGEELKGSLKSEFVEKDGENKQDIVSVVDVSNDSTKNIWVLPMETNKYLKGGVKNEKLKAILASVIGEDVLDDLANNSYSIRVKDSQTPFSQGTELSTAAQLAGSGDPFNTLTLYQNGYAIMNIHIYLEDFYGDKTAEAWNKYSSKNSGTNLEITSGNATLLFSVDNDNLLTTTLTTTDADGKGKIEYITQNAVMNNNQYLFENGLLLTWDVTNITLSMINKENKIKFAFNGILFEVSKNLKSDSIYGVELESGKTTINYFEELKDNVSQPTKTKVEEGQKTYKAEKIGDAQDDSDVIYKDKIEGNDFGFDNWEYSVSFKNKSGETIEAAATGKTIYIGMLGDDKQIKITINNLKDFDGNMIEGGYTFIVGLDEKPAVTIIGGNEGATSPDQPIDGNKIMTTQDKVINLKGDVFSVDDNKAELSSQYTGDKTSGNADDKELVDALFNLHALSYLKGVITLGGSSSSESNVFRFKKADGIETVSIVFDSAEYIIVRNDDGFVLKNLDGSDYKGGKFALEINKDLYDVEGVIEQKSETADPTSTDSGDSTDGADQPQERLIHISVTPAFTYRYRVESNEGAIQVVEFNKKSGELKLKGVASTETTVKFRFAVLRGTENAAKEVAYAYYSLTVSPCIEATISYPTIFVSSNTENTELIQQKQTTEYFYAGAGEFDVAKKSDITMGGEARIAVKKHIEKLAVSYTAMSNHQIIKGETTTENKVTNSEGKFKFDMSGVDVSEAEVYISVQVEADEEIYTFGQYKLTVCKNPVISTLITTEDGHLDGNGAEILPVNGGTELTPFNTAENGNGNIVVGKTTTPRLQFVYNNLILSSSYGSFMANGAPISKFTIPQTEIDSDVQTVEFTFYGQKVSGEYKYKRVWDFKMNPTLDSHTIEGNKDPNNESELLNYYYLDAGKTYNIIETFGITKYFGEKFDNSYKISNLTLDPTDNKCVELLSDGQSINIKGAPEGGLNFKIKFKAYGIDSAKEVVVGITALPTTEIIVNYRTETTVEDETGSKVGCGLIQSDDLGTTGAYTLVEKGKGVDFSIRRNGVTADITKSDYTLTIVGDQTDQSLGAKVQQTLDGATLAITNSPQLIGKRVVIKVEDNYGYFVYLRYVIAAKTQVEISNRDITFTTGGKIEWDENNKFPIAFKDKNEEEILTSFYEATISGATKDNISDTYGNSSSLMVDDGTLYGVQLDSVVTKTGVKYIQRKDGVWFSDTDFEVETDNETRAYSVKRNSDGGITEIKRTITETKNDKTYERTIKESTDGEWKFVDKVDGKDVVDSNFVLTEENIGVYYYIPYVSEKAISYDVYKLVAKDSKYKDVVLKSFDKYKKQIVEYYDGEKWVSTTPITSTTSGGNSMFGKDGAFYPKKKDEKSYFENYKISLYSTEDSKTPVATIEFNLLVVTKTDNLYYASREKAADCYTFAYNISIDGKNIVDGKDIENIGNGKYGSAQSLNTTLKITVSDQNETELDTIDVGILLKFGIYPKITQQISGITSFDYVGLDDNIEEVLKNKAKGIELVSDAGAVSGANRSYSKVLGDITSSSIGGTFEKMNKGTLAKGDYSYDPETRVLSLTETLSNGTDESKIKTATINNIQYVYNSDEKTLKIGYRVVPLTDGAFVDDVTGITYKVDETELSISKKVDNANTVTINNIKYTVETSNSTTTVNYETLYESIFVVWEYGGNTYWAQWNYKVVDKFNQVTTSDPLEAQDGNIKVKLDWVSGDYRFNPNTLELKKGDTVLGTAKWVSDSEGSHYEIEIGKTTYKIVIENNTMTFKNGVNYYPNRKQALVLEEEKKQNTSWADKIKLTGLDANVTSLSSAKDVVSIYVDVTEITDLKITSTADLTGTTHSVEINYTGIDGEAKDLLFNGNAVKVTFEHFSATA